MRDFKLLSSKKETYEKWVYPLEREWSISVFLWPQGANPEGEKCIDDLKNQSNSAWRVNSFSKQEKQLLEENVKWAQLKNSELDEKDVEFIMSTLRSLIYEYKNEYGLFSFYTINEFLAQDEIDRYGDYLNAHWDELYKAMSEGVYHIYAHSKKVLGAVLKKETLLAHRPRSAADVRAALENLSRAQISELTAMSMTRLKTTPSTLVEQIKSIFNDEPEQLYPLDQLKSQIFVAFSKSVASSGGTPSLSHLSAGALALKYIERLHRSFYSKKEYAKTGMLPTSVLKKLADVLEENGDRFQPSEMLSVIFSLTSPDGVVAAPKLVGLQFFKFVSKLQPEAQVQALKLAAELAFAYRGPLPSLKSWESFLTDGSLEIAISRELMFDLMGGISELKAASNGNDFREFRMEIRR